MTFKARCLTMLPLLLAWLRCRLLSALPASVYDSRDVLHWSTNTAGRGTAPRRFVMLNDGNAVIADSRNQFTWVSYTSRL